MAYSYPHRFDAARRVCGLREGMRHFRSFVIAIILLGSVGYVAWHFVRDYFLSELPRLLTQQLNQVLHESGWQISIKRAEWAEGSGLRLEHVQLFAPGGHMPAVELGRVIIDWQGAVGGTSINLGSIRHLQLDQDVMVDVGLLNSADCMTLFTALANFSKNSVSQGDLSIPRMLVNANLYLHDSTGVRLAQRHEFRKLRMSLGSRRERKGNQLIATGSFASKDCPQVEYSGFVDLHHGVWQFAGQARALILHEGWLNFVPQAWRPYLEHVELFRGKASVDFSATNGSMVDQAPRIEIRAEASDLVLFDRRWAHPLLGGTLTARMENHTVEILNLRGRLGTGEIDISRAYLDLQGANSWGLRGKVRGLEINHRWLSLLAAETAQLIRDLDPHGTVDLQIDIACHGTTIERDVKADFKNLDFSFKRFPYRLNHGVGSLRLQGEECRFSLQALEQGQIINLAGWLERPGPHAAFQLEFDSGSNLAIDSKLLSAIDIYPRVAQQVRALNINGRFGVRGRFYKQRDEPRAHLDYDIRLDKCLIRHAQFPYFVRDVSGLIMVRGERMTLHQVVGNHFGSRITCDGGWHEAEGLSLRIIGNDVALDRELFDASPQWIRNAWEALQPQGALDLARVDVRHRPGAPQPEVRLAMELRPPASTSTTKSVSIQPVSFPYRWERVTGTIEVADGRITLRNMRAQHGRTSLSGDGNGTYGVEGWRLDLERLWVSSLRVDDELLAAAPAELAAKLRALDYQGAINLSGRVGFGQSTVEKSSIQGDVAAVAYVDGAVAGRRLSATRIEWDVRLDLDQGRLHVGVPVENVFGAVRLKGQYDGREAVTAGVLAFETMTVFNAQCLNFQGPIWIDRHGVGVGKFAGPIMGSNSAAKQTAADSLRGEVFGGRVAFDGKIWQDVEGHTRFYLQTAGENLSVRSALGHLSPNHSDLSGTASGHLRLSGRADQQHSVVGDGRVEIKQAQLYELPVLFAILQVLLRPDKSTAAFDACRVDFTVQRQQVNLQRIELIGDAVSLLGNGQVNFHRQVDLNFFTVAGRNRFYIPIVTELYELGSQRIMWITVTGTLDQPKTQQVILPQMNEMFRQLLGEPRE